MTTAMVTLRRYVNGAITLMLHMDVPPTGITDRSGSTAASLLARDRGTAGAAAAVAMRAVHLMAAADGLAAAMAVGHAPLTVVEKCGGRHSCDGVGDCIAAAP